MKTVVGSSIQETLVTIKAPNMFCAFAAALAVGFFADQVRAQPGGCQRQQSSLRAGGMQSQLYAPSAPNFGQQSNLGQGSTSVLQQLAYQQAALQQYMLQQNALQQYLFQAQMAGFPGQNLLLANREPLDAADTADILKVQLENLQDYIEEQKEEGKLTSSQLRALRQREKTLTRKLRAAQKQAQRTASSTSVASYLRND
jgi:hypothetical protein